MQFSGQECVLGAGVLEVCVCRGNSPGSCIDEDPRPPSWTLRPPWLTPPSFSVTLGTSQKRKNPKQGRVRAPTQRR